MREILVSAERKYPIFIGEDWQRSLDVAVAVHSSVVLIANHFLIDLLKLDEIAQKRNLLLFSIPDGESAKSLEIVNSIWAFLGEKNIDRGAALVGIGGGATTDLTGFVAATWLRGISWYAVPTTLAGMVDAAIGGKTGINTESGKNLVGSFHSPSSVTIDPNFLSTLSDRDLAAGLAEVIKCGIIGDTEIISIISRCANLTDIRTHIIDLIDRSASLKARVVSADFKESELREILNFGHTFGHAVEKLSQYELRHGEAVSVGIAFALRLSSSELAFDAALAEELIDLLSRFELPTTIAGSEYPFEELLALMMGDKKSRSGTLRFVGVREIGTCERIASPNIELLRSVYETIAL